MSAHNCHYCGKACGATADLCAPCELNIVKLALKDAQAERDEAQARARRAEADVNGAWNAHGMVFDELNRAHAELKDAQAERDEARALNHRGLMKLVENERLRDALEEIAGMCSENAKQMQAIAQDALGSMPPSNLPYICPKSVAVAEDLTPGEVTSEAEEERDLLRAQLAVATATIADWARVTGCETPDDFEATR